MDKKKRTAPVKIDIKAIPAADMRVLCSTILDAVMRFYESPENRRQFEIWKSEVRQGGKVDV